MQSLFPARTAGDPALRALSRAAPVTNVGPWQRISDLHISGLTALGFERGSNLMLVCSTSGQSVIDSANGEVLYRNTEADGLDISALKGTRLDHPADERFDMAGRDGGALRRVTEDGWSVDVSEGLCLLHAPKQNGRTGTATAPGGPPHLLHRLDGELRAFGFSWTSQTLALATDSTLMLWHRPAPLRL